MLVNYFEWIRDRNKENYKIIIIYNTKRKIRKKVSIKKLSLKDK